MEGSMDLCLYANLSYISWLPDNMINTTVKIMMFLQPECRAYFKDDRAWGREHLELRSPQSHNFSNHSKIFVLYIATEF